MNRLPVALVGWLVVALVASQFIALVGCSKAPRTSHEEVPATRPLDAQGMGAPPVLPTNAPLDAQTMGAPLDAQTMGAPLDAQTMGAPLVDANVEMPVVDARATSSSRDAGTTSRDAGATSSSRDAGTTASSRDAGTTASSRDAGTTSPSKLGKLGDICARGSRGRDSDEGGMSRPVLECEKGLICCYPCGIPGCDSVCKKTCPAVP